MVSDSSLKAVIRRVGREHGPVKAVAELLQEGMTVPFIARYRKEATGNLDEVAIQEIQEAMTYVHDLTERKATILKTIREQEKLTPELEREIASCLDKQQLEDLYLPFKPRRRTRATVARERGLEPLSQQILEGRQETLNTLAAPFVNEGEDGLSDVQQVLAGAGDIIAELFSENAELRHFLRTAMIRNGILEATVTDDWKEKRSKFEQYYEHREPVSKMPSHRILAIRRGEREKVLRSRIDLPWEGILKRACALVIPRENPHRILLESIAEDALKRLLLPSIELDVRSELKRGADEEAIRVFAANLEHLLLSPPAGNMRVMGVDPGFRTGCKLVALSETGRLLEHGTIYPTKPKEQMEEAKKVVLDMITLWKVEAVAIGNGTASRETEAFFRQCVPKGIPVVVVNEAGASVYSASAEGREEFPDHDVTVRGSVSIGRRFQDPLSELVKIDPKSIGVGQYQHDVNQSLLKKRLDTTVESVVNRVGVDVNTASWHLLRYVSGIGETLARNIVHHRDENGGFTSRDSLKDVRLFGDKAFLQSAGFLRIRGGENPLDRTGIHPESYFVAEKIISSTALTLDELIGNDAILDQIELKPFVCRQFGIPTLTDIVKELKNPGRDPRDSFAFFGFTEGITELEDLAEGMTVNGIITNVTNFGAFVDVGVHQDGLVHISELSDGFVQRAEDVVRVGQQVVVRVLQVDLGLRRISLSLRQAKQK